MTRREFISTAALAATTASAAPSPVRVPVNRVVDSRARFTPEEMRRFTHKVWSEAVQDFARCGVVLEIRESAGEIRRSPGGRPVFQGLDRRMINVVLTRHIPMAWDNGRGLVGVSTQYDGHQLSVIAVGRAHGHQVPFLSVNTCVHELLHVLLQDIFVGDATRLRRGKREFRIDWLATRLWLFHDGREVRKAAQAWVDRMRGTGMSQ